MEGADGNSPHLEDSKYTITELRALHNMPLILMIPCC